MNAEQLLEKLILLENSGVKLDTVHIRAFLSQVVDGKSVNFDAKFKQMWFEENNNIKSIYFTD